MAVVFIPNKNLTKEDMNQIETMDGKIMRWILEKRSIRYMAEKLKMEPKHVEENIDEMLYQLRKQVGNWRYFKLMFWK